MAWILGCQFLPHQVQVCKRQFAFYLVLGCPAVMSATGSSVSIQSPTVLSGEHEEHETKNERAHENVRLFDVMVKVQRAKALRGVTGSSISVAFTVVIWVWVYQS